MNKYAKSEREVKTSTFQNRREMIDFIEMKYGWIECNEPLSILLIKHNP